MEIPANLEQFPTLLANKDNNQELTESELVFTKAVELQCLLSIGKYLTELADTMESNQIEAIGPQALRSMAEVLVDRAMNPSQDQPG